MDNVNEPKLEQFLSYNMPINFKLQIEVNQSKTSHCAIIGREEGQSFYNTVEYMKKYLESPQNKKTVEDSSLLINVALDNFRDNCT